MHLVYDFSMKILRKIGKLLITLPKGKKEVKPNERWRANWTPEPNKPAAKPIGSKPKKSKK
jgi:hypothetical protein